MFVSTSRLDKRAETRLARAVLERIILGHDVCLGGHLNHGGIDRLEAELYEKAEPTRQRSRHRRSVRHFTCRLASLQYTRRRLPDHFIKLKTFKNYFKLILF